MKILMVCLGNICRSPLAQGIFERKLQERGLDWEIDSAGTGMWHIGEQPDPRSMAVARTHGLDISSQRARQIKAADLKRFDLILAMDRSNYRDIRRLEHGQTSHAELQLMLDPHPGSIKDVPDPYWDDDGFEQVYRLLDEAADRWIEMLLQQDRGRVS